MGSPEFGPVPVDTDGVLASTRDMETSPGIPIGYPTAIGFSERAAPLAGLFVWMFLTGQVAVGASVRSPSASGMR